MADDTLCSICSVTRDAAQLQACRICREMFCGDCAFRSRGGTFCSSQCANTFFFGDEDESDRDEDYTD
jgi:hypothetical protein